MKKFILILLLFLSACSSNNIDLQKEVKYKIDKENRIATFSPNNTKPYYSYYLDQSVGKIYSNKSNNIFNYNGINFVMNLNISNIINNKYYETNSIDSLKMNDKLLFLLEGTYKNYKNNDFNYKCYVYNIGDKYIINFASDYVEFYAKGSKVEIIEVAGKMMQIARSFEINKENIISDYSSKENIEFKKETVKLFDTVVPVNGNVQDIIENNENIDKVEDNNEQNNSQIDDNYSTDNYKY